MNEHTSISIGSYCGKLSIIITGELVKVEIVIRMWNGYDCVFYWNFCVVYFLNRDRGNKKHRKIVMIYSVGVTTNVSIINDSVIWTQMWFLWINADVNLNEVIISILNIGQNENGFMFLQLLLYKRCMRHERRLSNYCSISINQRTKKKLHYIARRT